MFGFQSYLELRCRPFQVQLVVYSKTLFVIFACVDLGLRVEELDALHEAIASDGNDKCMEDALVRRYFLVTRGPEIRSRMALQ
jgi:hypothetical protein